METTCVFKRVEKKYLLTEERYDALFRRIGAHLKPDEFGRSTVLSLYLDTPDHRIIRNSIEAVDYKGVVYKRRAVMTLAEAERYLEEGTRPYDSQIMAEIDWAMKLYGYPKPAMMIACEREAWFDGEHPDLRLTFDRGIRYRQRELHLSSGGVGTALLPENTVLLEIKTGGAMPLWLSHALDAERILPGSFSKYGAAYTRSLEEIRRPARMIVEGGSKHVVNL